MPPPQNPVQELLALYAQRRFADMERMARALVQQGASAPILDELLGMALAAQRRFADALPLLKKAADAVPTDAQFQENLGNCQRELGQFAEAEQTFRKSLAIRPNGVEALNALASVLTAQGKFPEAETCLRKAATLSPADPRAFALLANLLAKTLRKLEAVQTADAAVQRIGTPTREVIASNIGPFDVIAEAYGVAGDYDSAAKIFKELCTLAPSLGRSLAAYPSLRWTCDWETTATIESDLRNAIRGGEPMAGSANIAIMMPSVMPEDFLLAMKKTAAPFEAVAKTRPSLVSRSSGDRRASQRIRVGYFSSDFRENVVSHVFAGVFEAHDRERFEIVACDSSPPGEDAYRKRLGGAFERWLPLADLSDDQAAQRIAGEEIDILFSFGWTQGQRALVLARRPVPVQIAIGGPTGAPWIDYQIADRIVVPPDYESHYSEKLIRLPDTFFPTDIRKPANAPLSRKQYDLPEQDMVFCSFNMTFKFTPELFDVWLRLLRDVPGSVLWLKEVVVRAEESLKAYATKQGVDPARIVFAQHARELGDHLARVSIADIALDTFPYGSQTTATDMILMGVPIVALKGETSQARVSASVLSAANLPDLVTSSFDDYYRLAHKLATDAAMLAEMKRRTREARNSPLFDTARFTRHLETGYRMAWERHLAGLPPANIDVPA